MYAPQGPVPKRVRSFDSIVHILAVYLATDNLVPNTPSDPQEWDRADYHWQVAAISVTVAWIYVLFHMRLLPKIGIYIMIFTDVVLTFLRIVTVFVILLFGYAFSFHMLLPHRQEFEHVYDALLKTVIMMSGDMFFCPCKKIL